MFFDTLKCYHRLVRGSFDYSSLIVKRNHAFFFNKDKLFCENSFFYFGFYGTITLANALFIKLSILYEKTAQHSVYNGRRPCLKSN